MLEFFKSQNSNRMRFEIAGFEIAGSNRQIAGFGNAKEGIGESRARQGREPARGQDSL